MSARLVRWLVAAALIAAAFAYLTFGGMFAFVMMFGPSNDLMLIAAASAVLAIASIVVAIQLTVASTNRLLPLGVVLAVPGLLLILARYTGNLHL